MSAYRRRISCAVLGALVLGWPAVLPSAAQTPPVGPTAPSATAARSLLQSALSSARFQARAAEFAISKQPRPEVRAFAQEMLEFRRLQLPTLEALARNEGIQVSTVLDFEHSVILENLEPLDFIAFSRRWAEVQIQALQQEIRIYDASRGQAGGDQKIQQLTDEMIPRLQTLLAQASEVHTAIRE